MIQSVGRIVHYVSFGAPNGEYTPECRAAVVTEVPSSVADPQVLALCVLHPTGYFFDRTVPHDQTNKASGTWHWPERPAFTLEQS